MAQFELSEILPEYSDFGPIPERQEKLAGVYMGNNVVLTRIWLDHQMMVYTGDMIVSPHLINIGVNEPHVTRLIVSLTRPGDVFVDVGANVGYYSVLAGWQCYPDGQVWAIEPNPNIYPLLSDNIRNNGYAEIAHRRQIALSDRVGTAPLRIFKGYEATSTIRDVPEAFIEHTRVETGRESYVIDIAVTTLDALMADVPKIDVMKIDVEGHEPAMIRGALGILARSPSIKIIMEFVPPIMGPEASRELIGLLRGLDFLIYRIETEGTFTLQDDDETLLQTPFADLLLFRRAADNQL